MPELFGLLVAALELLEGHLLLDELHHDLLLFTDASPLLAKVTLGAQHILLSSHLGLLDLGGAGTRLDFFHWQSRLRIVLLFGEKFVARVVPQVILALLLDDIEG